MARISARVRREALVEAAIRVMVREGVAAATTRAIVAEADMSLGVFHYCFDSREQLLREVTRRLTDGYAAVAREGFASAGDLRSAVSGSLREFWARVENAPNEELLGFELTQYAIRQKGFGDLARHQYAHYLEVLEDFLVGAARDAQIEWSVPITLLARYINATLDGLSLTWLVDGNTEQSREALDLLTDYVVACARPTA